MSEQPSCFNCRHLRLDKSVWCAAFDGPIPFAIVSGQVDHTSPVEGDNGMQWEPLEDDAA